MSDVAAFRARFPALERRHNGHPVAYFDGPGGTQVPKDVVDAIADYMFHHNANTAWQYPSSIETDAALAGARAAVADLLGGAPDEIAFGNNMTTITFHVSRALGRAWGPKDTVVVTELDHHGNIGPWRALEKERGVQIITVRMNAETGELDTVDLDRALATKPKLLAIGAASNAIGTMPDIAAAAKRAHAVGALVYVDAVHYAPHVLVDVAKLGCDFLACSAYKFYGPHIGILWGKRALLDSLDVPRIDPAPDYSPDRFEPGTQNHEGIVGTAAVVDFLASFGTGATRRERLASSYRAMHTRAADLFGTLWNGLGAIKGVKRYGPPPTRPRTATLSIGIDGLSLDDAARQLAEKGLFLSNGDFYASTVAERMSPEKGFLRIGIVGYTTADEVQRLLTAIEGVRGRG